MRLTPTQIEQTLALAEKTGECIMAYYKLGFDVKNKPDNSPVTQADIAASQQLESELPNIAPYPVLSEENTPQTARWKNWKTYWLIDPIDGTKHFINKTGEFCICIALIHQNRAVLGLIYAPSTQTAWVAQSGDAAVIKYEQNTRSVLSSQAISPITATISAKHLTDKMATLLEPLDNYQWKTRGSALKYVDIIEGKASIYPKLWDTCEWDSAAGQCLVEVAGGQVLCLENGDTLHYGQRDSLINPYFIAFNHLSPAQVRAILQQYQRLKKENKV